MKPNMRPARPDFSSGPCAKRPGWTPEALKDAATGRSHRSKTAKKKIVEAVDRTRSILGIPADYRIAIVPASDTGAVEMALWSLLGARPVDMLTWESFGEGWVTDVVKQLKLKDARVLKAPYGQIADLKQVDWTHDVVFTWNGTTSGVKVPNGDWIAADREGLAICDATSAVFAMDLPWQKLDVDHLVLAEGDGRRGRARHAGAEPARHRAARELHAGLAAAQDLPPHVGRQILRGDLQGRHHQHALDALRRGRDRRPALGRGRRRPEGPDGPLRGQSRRAGRLRRGAAVGFVPGGRQGDPVQHLGVPGDQGAVVHGARRPTSRRRRPRRWPTCSRPRRPATTSAPIATPRRACASGAAPRWRQSDLEALLPWLDWAYGEIEREFGKAAA